MTAHRVVLFLSLLALAALATFALIASAPACGQVVPATAPGVEAVIANIEEGPCGI